MNWSLILGRFLELVSYTGRVLCDILPYLIAGIMLGELIKFTSWTKIIYKGVTKSPFISVFSAVIIGVISPLCTVGTIPVVIQLYKSKVHVAPLFAFLAASSLMNPQLFIMTAGGINLEMALARTIAVMIFSIAVGLLIYIIPKSFIVRKNILLDDNDNIKKEEILNREKKPFLIKEYVINCLKNIRHFGIYLLIGIILSGIIELYVPNDLIYMAFALDRETTPIIKVRSILAGALLGIPLSPCGGTAIPIVHGMMLNGMGKGTALAFFIVGPATRPAPLIAMSALLTPLFLAIYCLFLIISSVIMGLLYI